MAALAPDHVTPAQDKAIGRIKEWLRVAHLARRTRNTLWANLKRHSGDWHAGAACFPIAMNTLRVDWPPVDGEFTFANR
jgi:hypothetical protein